jgi:hypothetical protein
MKARSCIGFEIRGTSPLIQNAFAQKSVEQMLSKHMGRPVEKAHKVPRQVLEAACVRNEKGTICMSPVCFKSAMINAASTVKSYDRKKKVLLISFAVEGLSIPITYEVPGLPASSGYRARLDVVRTSGIQRTVDLRFRPEFPGWGAQLAISFEPDILTAEGVTDLLDRAGRVGVGEWRPEKRGTFGQWEIVRALEPKETEKAIADSQVPLVSLQIPDWALDAEIDVETLSRLFDGTKAGVEEGLEKIKEVSSDSDEE